MNGNIYLLGDIHGDITPIDNFINNQDIHHTENDVLILLGDVGANYYLNGRDSKFKKKLSKYNLTYFCVRGNHEERPSILAEQNPNDWHTEEFFGNSVLIENAFPQIRYALDSPAIYNIPLGNKEVLTLIIPGAYSVDKNYRLEKGWQWFPNEQLNPEEIEKARVLFDEPYEIILSHTCPISWEPTDLFLSVVNQSTVDKTMERFLEEELQISIKKQNHPKFWFFGHYHQFRVYPPHFNVQPIMLFNDITINLNQCWKAENKLELLNSCYNIKNKEV